MKRKLNTKIIKKNFMNLLNENYNENNRRQLLNLFTILYIKITNKPNQVTRYEEAIEIVAKSSAHVLFAISMPGPCKTF